MPRCVTHCPMAPALLESAHFVGYLKVADAQYRHVWAGQPNDPDAGILFAPRLPGGVSWVWDGQGARSALALDGYGRLVRKPIVVGLAVAWTAPAAVSRLYLSLLQNVAGGCP